MEKSQNSLSKIENLNAQKYSLAQSHAKELSSLIDELEPIPEDNPDESPITQLLVECIQSNRRRDPTGGRFGGLEKFFVLLSFMGPHYYKLLHTTLLFPSYRTVLQYRKDMMREMDIDCDAYNGSPRNIENIIRFFLSGDFDGRAIIAIDAASVTPNVTIHYNGAVTCLIEPLAISDEESEEIIGDPERFDNFVSDHADTIVKAEFVVMLIPVDASHKAFPICCFPATHAIATAQMLDTVIAISEFVKSIGIDIAGIATDGDRQYLKLSMSLMMNILDNIQDVSQWKVSEILTNFGDICHFADPYHLVKRDRYRKISNTPYVVDP
jgi:hypothetical protein